MSLKIQFVRLKGRSLRLLSVFLIILGLIGLVVGQGRNKPESSLNTLESVGPHAAGEIFDDQSILLNLPVEGVVIFVSANTFVRSEGEIAATITNSNQDEFDFKSDWMDYRELTIMYFDSKGVLRSDPDD